MSNVRLNKDDTVPSITFTLTNNNELICSAASLGVTGGFSAKDGYGDATSVTEPLYVIDARNGSDMLKDIAPGSIDLKLIPLKLDNVVATYKSDSSAEKQQLTISDLNDVHIEVSGASYYQPPKNDYAILGDSEYEFAPTTVVVDTWDGREGLSGISGQITNKTSFKWEKVQVFLASLNASGDYAGNTSLKKRAPLFFSLEAEYLKPGQTAELSEYDFKYGDDVATCTVTYVKAKKDTEG